MHEYEYPSMIFYKVIDPNGVVIFNTLTKELETEFEKLAEAAKKITIDAKTYKIAIESNSYGTVYFASCNNDSIKSHKLFIKEMEIVTKNLPHLQEIYKSIATESGRHINRLIHNLVTLNAHNIQEVYSIIPQEIMQNKKSGWNQRIVEQVNKDPYEASLALVRIAKNNLKMKTEIDVYNSLLSGHPDIKLRRHEIHRVLMNVLYVFFPDFTDKDVYVDVSESKHVALLDYETFQVAIYHLIENTVKYIKPSTTLKIDIEKHETTKKISIHLKMNSLRIEPGEEDKIFEEGYSGNIAKICQRSGSGIGMARIKQLLKYNQAELKVTPHFETAKPEILNHIYQDNEFKIYFH